jgi:hypothetical protein
LPASPAKGVTAFVCFAEKITFEWKILPVLGVCIIYRTYAIKLQSFSCAGCWKKCGVLRGVTKIALVSCALDQGLLMLLQVLKFHGD